VFNNILGGGKADGQRKKRGSIWEGGSHKQCQRQRRGPGVSWNGGGSEGRKVQGCGREYKRGVEGTEGGIPRLTKSFCHAGEKKIMGKGSEAGELVGRNSGVTCQKTES